MIVGYLSVQKVKDWVSEDLFIAATAALVVAGGSWVYREGAGFTVTAAYAQPLGETLSEFAGTEAAFKQMTDKVSERLEVLEKLARLESELGAAERRKQELERQYAALERTSAETERKLADAERKLQQAFRQQMLAKEAAAAEYLELSFGPSAYIELETPFDSFLLESMSNRAEVEDPDFWISATGDQVFLEEDTDFYIVAGKAVDYAVHIKWISPEGVVYDEGEATIYSEDYQKVDEGMYQAMVNFEYKLPASRPSDEPLVRCASAVNSASGQVHIDGFTFKPKDVRFIDVKWESSGEVLNRLPKSIYADNVRPGDVGIDVDSLCRTAFSNR